MYNEMHAIKADRIRPPELRLGAHAKPAVRVCEAGGGRGDGPLRRSGTWAVVVRLPWLRFLCACSDLSLLMNDLA